MRNLEEEARVLKEKETKSGRKMGFSSDEKTKQTN